MAAQVLQAVLAGHVADGKNVIQHGVLLFTVSSFVAIMPQKKGERKGDSS